MKFVEVTVRGQEVTGTFVTDQEAASSGDEDEEEQEPKVRQDRQSRNFSTILPSFEDPELIELLDANDVVIHAEPDQENWLGAIFISLLPWLLIIG